MVHLVYIKRFQAEHTLPLTGTIALSILDRRVFRSRWFQLTWHSLLAWLMLRDSPPVVLRGAVLVQQQEPVIRDFQQRVIGGIPHRVQDQIHFVGRFPAHCLLRQLLAVQQPCHVESQFGGEEKRLNATEFHEHCAAAILVQGHRPFTLVVVLPNTQQHTAGLFFLGIWLYVFY